METWSKSIKLGSGSYGTVFLAFRVDSYNSLRSTVMAVKSAAYNVDRCVVSSLKAEGNFLAQLNGTPNIVRCFGEDVSVENGWVVYNLLLEYAAGGSLQDLIRNAYNDGDGGGGMSEAHIACYASMLLTGLEEIHSQGIVHCDLKPANVLVFPVGGGISQLKIADFGLARRVWEEEEIRVSGGRKCYNRGTPLYSSPESVEFGLHGTRTDIWSFGCIVFEMMTGKRMWSFKNRKDMFDQILHGKVEAPKDLSEYGMDFLNRCLKRDPQKRWSAKQLLHHPFIVKNLKMMSEIHGFDLNIGKQHFQRNPFGVCGWLSKRHLFSTNILEATQQRQQQLFQPYKLFSEQPSQFPCGAAVIDLIKENNLVKLETECCVYTEF